MQSPKVYDRVPEAEDIIKELCEKYDKVLWAVRPEIITVMGITNKDRGKATKVDARIKSMTGVQKEILKINDINVRYVIELYWSDWNKWDTPKKQWVLLDQLLAVSPEVEKLNKPDIKDFKIVVDVVGVSWADEDVKLPNLITTDVPFNLELRPGLEEAEAGPGAEDDKTIFDKIVDAVEADAAKDEVSFEEQDETLPPLEDGESVDEATEDDIFAND